MPPLFGGKNGEQWRSSPKPAHQDLGTFFGWSRLLREMGKNTRSYDYPRPERLSDTRFR